MKSIFTVFLDIEKLIYKVLMWVILVPKTIVKITLNPAWAPGYVKDELENDETPFDEYISPIILLLIVALIPALAFNLLPTYGATISSPAETQPTTDRILSFDVRTDFRSSSASMEYFHSWSVTKVRGAPAISQTGGEAAPPASFEDHYPNSPINFIKELDENTTKDTFLFTFPDAGEYVVSVIAGKYDPKRFNPETGTGIPTETYSTSLRVIVPVKTDEQIVISNEQSRRDAEAARTQGFETITAQVQKENTIFLALALMLPPLLFALATKLFKEGVSEDALKENFYTQCYYFSPLSLAIWASYYARYFFTSDAYFYADGNIAVQIIWLSPLLAALWFIRAEVKTLEDAREINGIRALLITLVCIAILAFAANVIFRFAAFQDDMRLIAIRAFPLFSAALIATFGIAWYRRRRDRKENVKGSHFFWIGVNAVVLLVLLNFISGLFASPSQPQVVSRTLAAGSSLSAPTDLADSPGRPTATLPAPTSTPQILAAENSPTPEATLVVVLESPTPEPQPFYTEEFNTDLVTWSTFMTSGDSRMVVEPRVERGALPLQLLQVEDKIAQFYLINDAFSYSDVKIETIVTNRGNNSNGVGLICRYSDIGWYEAQISNSERFSIFVVDNIGIVSQGYNEVAAGDSKVIHSGLSTNVYTLTCRGNVIRLFVNGELLGEYVDEKFGFTDGKIGISVWSPLTLPVNVEIETLTVSAP